MVNAIGLPEMYIYFYFHGKALKLGAFNFIGGFRCLFARGRLVQKIVPKKLHK
jgi:hypothetical protein